MPKLYLIDGSGFIFRAYHSLPPLTNPAGVPVGAVYGFTNMLMRLVDGTKADYIAVIFDAGRQTFRSRLYDQYKANRPEAPEDLKPQFSIVRDATRALNLPAIEMADYEADDLIATYTKQARAQGMEVVIVSSDKDLMQLIGDGITMWDPMKQKDIGYEQVLEKFGVPPEKVIEVMALIGDSSDNIPGVPGIGPKTAAELIGQYGDLENLLAHAHEIKQPKRRETIEQNADKARLSKELVTLHYEVPTPEPIENFTVKKPNFDVLGPFLLEHGFKSLLARVSKSSEFGVQDSGKNIEAPIQKSISQSVANNTIPLNPESRILNPDYTLVQDEASLTQWITQAKAAGHVAFDTETTGLDTMQAELVGFSLCCEVGKACYVPLAHGKRIQDSGFRIQESLFGEVESRVKNEESSHSKIVQIPLDKAIALIKPLLEDPSVLKIGHNIKYDMQIMARYGVGMVAIEDTMLLSYVLSAGKHAQNMDELAQRYLGHKTITFGEVVGAGKNKVTFAEVELEKARDYAAEDADITLRMAELFKPQLVREHLVNVYETYERPLIPVLSQMERHGIKVDRLRLQTLSGEFALKMAVLEEDAYKLAGHPFNLGSPKQLGEILFDEMQLSGGSKSAKTGAYATGADVLEELADQGHALPAKVLEWRGLSKLKSTYTDALVAQINPTTGRVHTSYAMAVASTGRLSSTDPNLQNIPIRSEEGKKIREAFVAAPGYKLISADYSQIELRLLAHVADIPVLKAAFREGKDIHAITASQMFGVPVDQVDSDLRRKAKTINFGIIYGISAHGLAARLGIGRSEAGDYIKKYFAQYPGIVEYMERTKDYARAHGYVTTLYGRRCHLPGINDRNGSVRQFSERAAINAPLQGTAADIIKRAMIQVDRELRHPDEGGTKMLLQVHDELVFEAPEATAPSVAAKMKKIMENSAHLSIPLEVETGVGDNWGQIH